MAGYETNVPLRLTNRLKTQKSLNQTKVIKDRLTVKSDKRIINAKFWWLNIFFLMKKKKSSATLPFKLVARMMLSQDEIQWKRIRVESRKWPGVIVIIVDTTIFNNIWRSSWSSSSPLRPPFHQKKSSLAVRSPFVPHAPQQRRKIATLNQSKLPPFPPLYPTSGHCWFNDMNSVQLRSEKWL